MTTAAPALGGDPRPLTGVGVLVTRPAHQAEGLCGRIEALGGEAIRFPVLAIRPPADPGAAAAVLARAADYRLVVFTSANAAEHGIALARRLGVWPPGPAVAAIGRATARALAGLGVTVSLQPRGPYDSEALLALPELAAVTGWRILVVRGEGGRDLLARTLSARGARVEYAEVYRRVLPKVDPGPLLARWRQGGVQVAVVTSNEGLRNLFDLLGEAGQQWMTRTPLVAVSPRTVELAGELGYTERPVLAREASDEAIVEALLRWQQDRFQ